VVVLVERTEIVSSECNSKLAASTFVDDIKENKMPKPDEIYLYRITHIDNLDFILEKGKITCPNNPNCDPNFIRIGDSTLIQSRSSRLINVAPNGRFSDYVAFYFGARSPMLYNIQKGYNNVTKRTPEEVIYLITTFEKIKESRCLYVFTDGHAYHNLSQFFNREEDLENVDWKAVNLVRWNDTEDDPDRKRRKQAEFLVYRELPTTRFVAIVVYNEAIKTAILAKFARHDFVCNVFVKPKWYY
jgi:ssDNA thymidine ADP-ribosyltransferase, DarT